jgi:hypothetical protein
MIGKGREPTRDEPQGSSCPAGAAPSGKRSTLDDGAILGASDGTTGCMSVALRSPVREEATYDDPLDLP